MLPNDDTTPGVITEYPVDVRPGIALDEITVGSDGALWFTGYEGAIWRITTAGLVGGRNSFPDKGKATIASRLAAASGTALWAECTTVNMAQ